MLQTLHLLLPALIPSWRFFDAVGPSPRIEYALLRTPEEAAAHWQEFRRRPATLSFGAMLGRLFWNPRWNESLFLVSCAERLMAHDSEHSAREILQRLRAEWARGGVDGQGTPYCRFRLIFLMREGTQIETHVTFLSPVHPTFEAAAS